MSCRSYLPDHATCVGGSCVRRWAFTFSLDCLSLGFTLICLTVAGGLLGL